MNEIKPVYQLKYVTGCIDITEEQYFRESYMRGTPRRILYPAAAYEALRKENEALIQKLETAAFNHFAAQEKIEALQKENGQWKTVLNSNEQIRVAQAKRITELENDLIEWNEFKKIRDTQMQALRKQMS